MTWILPLSDEVVPLLGKRRTTLPVIDAGLLTR